jgi:metallo-beta-lactamase class B
MRKFLLITFLFPFCLNAQFTIKVNSLPSNTPVGSTIFAAGTFNNWKANDSAFILKEISGVRQITIPASSGSAQFKFTRGSWQTVEGSASGAYIPNRNFTYSSNGILNCDIAGWEDLKQGGGPSSTANKNVRILSDTFYMPQLNRKRKIWIYLPEDYQTTSKTYPVLYMHDGQNIFDNLTAFAGEWGVDEALSNREKLGQSTAIVVAIDNGGSTRIDEYSPYKNAQYGGGEGDEYADFITLTLKPFIDSAYRTKPEFVYTGIAGSSMGAVISMYTVAKYPNVYSKLGIFSPAFWFSDSLFTFVKNTQLNKGLKVYNVSGATESKNMVPDMKRMDSLLIAKGLDSSSRFLTVKADGAHSEWFWKREFPAAFNFLFPPLLNGYDELVESPNIRIFPNPAIHYLQIKTPIEIDSFMLINSVGYIVYKRDKPEREPKVDVSGLANGNYVLAVFSDKKVFYKKFSVQN